MSNTISNITINNLHQLINYQESSNNLHISDLINKFDSSNLIQIILTIFDLSPAFPR